MSSILEKVMNTKPHISVTPFEKKKFLIYGPAGVGKSTFFSKFKNHLFLNTDPGIDFIKVRNIPITSWKQFKKLVEELVSYQAPDSKFYDHRYDNMIIVLDLIDGLQALCRKSILNKYGLAHESDTPYGKTFDMVKSEFQTVIGSLAAVYGIGFISHAKDIEIKGRIDKLSKVVPTISGGAGKFVEGLCDFIGYCEVSTTKEEKALGPRYITFQPQEDLTAKNRGNLFPNKMPLDFDVVYDTYQKNFSKNFMSDSPSKGAVKIKKFKTK